MRIRYFIILIIFTITTFTTFGWSRIEIGEEFHIMMLSQNNFSDYNDAEHDKHSFTLQRTRIYLNGELQKGIKAYLKLQSIGFWGVTDAKENVVSTDYIQLGHFKYPNFTPWIEHAYIHLDNALKDFGTKYKVNITVGKQPLKYGDGFVVDDNGNGAFALKFSGNLPLKITGDYFSAKMLGTEHNQMAVNKNLSLSGIVLKRKLKGWEPELYYITENDKTNLYITDGNLKDGESKKVFYGLRIENRSEEKALIKAEYIKQGGQAKTYDMTTNTEDNFTFDAYAYIFGVSAVSSKYGKTEIKFEYAFGSGDKNQADLLQYRSANGFSPLCGRKNRMNGENNYYGEIFSQLPYGFNLADKSITVFGIKSNPYKTLTVGFDFLTLKTAHKESYGEEIDLTASVKYSHSVSFRFVHAYLTPGQALLNGGSNISETNFEMRYKF